MKKFFFTIVVCCSLCVSGLFAQETFPLNGTKENNKLYYAFINATIFVDYQTRIDSATLLIKEGKIEAVGKKVTIPKGAVITDLKNKFIYPSLIDIYTSYGLPEVKKEKGGNRPQLESNTKGAYAWNQSLKPEYNASSVFSVDSKKAEELRKNGFGAALTLQKDGIARGTSAFVLLGEGTDNKQLLNDKTTACYSFRKGNSDQTYPSSLMGSIALLRQTYFDAQWYAAGGREEEGTNLSLKAWNENQSLPQVFETDDFLSALRADKLGDEFGIQYILKGSGTEYRRMDEIKATNAAFILPINFPEPYDVEDPFDALVVDLEDLKHWEMAPTNPVAFEKNNIAFAITADTLKNYSKFWKNLRRSIELGLSEAAALKAITYTPAKLAGMDNVVGSLKQGMKANFIITSTDLFDKKNVILENWVDGISYKINPLDVHDIRGVYDLTIGGSVNYKLHIEGEERKPKAKIFYTDTASLPGEISVERKIVTISFPVQKGKSELIRMSGAVEAGELKGRCQLPTGTWSDWKAVYRSAYIEKPEKDSVDENQTEIGQLIYPFTAYGWSEQPKQEAVLIKNATVWTNEKQGKLEGTDVLIENGKISKVGKGLTSSVKTIDGTGKHLTAGIIDEHSHIAISKGVNEGGQASSAEVRIGDVINSEDVNIYRQLAGGVVASQLLHGSANPIGGQSGLIKLRWGLSPEKMKIENADGFIKFALGENVKQSNWGDDQTVRFPQTRMGVEQVYYDAFIRAKEYEKAMRGYNKLSSKQQSAKGAPRRDIELDALAEILNKERFITCHSYIQSEINMLMHVADSMGFIVNTFTHILEGYKVADKMKARGVGASTFSDWWAYKFEVNDAIPYNASILNKQGVVTAINSDDAEMGRRLNQEAAKSVKYGGMSEEDAWKMVTLNPAKLLHLDNRMGSIKEGKDADVVLWSDNPLSVYARAEKTFVDGVCYYDSERDIQLRTEIRKERARLIQKMIAAKKAGEKTKKPGKKEHKLYHCDTMDEYY